MKRRWFWLLCALLFAFAGGAQTPAPPPAAFDAVTIKPFRPPRGYIWDRAPHTDPGRLYFEGATAEAMILYAYDINADQLDFQMGGLSDWAQNSLFQLTAVTHAPATPDQMKHMLQRVLQERFQLEVAETDAVQPVDGLEVAPGGLKIQPWRAASPCSPASVARAGMPQLPRPLIATYAGCSLADVVDILNARLRPPQLPVVDRTGLTGAYPILIWQRLDCSGPGGGCHPQSIEAAVRQKLGLILVKTTAPWRRLHVTRIAPPAPDA